MELFRRYLSSSNEITEDGGANIVSLFNHSPFALLCYFLLSAPHINGAIFYFVFTL